MAAIQGRAEAGHGAQQHTSAESGTEPRPAEAASLSLQASFAEASQLSSDGSISDSLVQQALSELRAAWAAHPAQAAGTQYYTELQQPAQEQDAAKQASGRHLNVPIQSPAGAAAAQLAGQQEVAYSEYSFGSAGAEGAPSVADGLLFDVLAELLQATRQQQQQGPAAQPQVSCTASLL